jgi:beta-glucosidase
MLLAASAGMMTISGVVSTAAEAQSRRTETSRPMADAAYWNESLPVEQRVADLLARMTLEEKIAQITTIWTGKSEIQDAENHFDPAKASANRPNGIGQIARPSDVSGPSSPRQVRRRSIENSVAYVNAVQRWAREQTRLGIPVLFHPRRSASPRAGTPI